ncbi:Uncharacterised protein [Edwardsiella tarda]|nr:Uncharacterised protein [Edwardsiella tarda]
MTENQPIDATSLPLTRAVYALQLNGEGAVCR